jgi:hypothetical protein
MEEIMDLALIPPLGHLHHTGWTNTQMILPLFELVENSRYKSFYSDLADDNNQFLILDNGEAEGDQQPFDHVLSLGRLWRVDEVVLPDVMYNKSGTLSKIKKALDFIDDEPFTFMAVAQGGNRSEFQQSIDVLFNIPEVSTIGIPRHALDTCTDHLARARMASYISEMNIRYGKDIKIHFLGASPLWPQEGKFLADPDFLDQTYIRSMDTSLPYTLAVHGLSLKGARRAPSRPHNYFNNKPEQSITDKNVQQLIDWTVDAS